MAHNIYVARQPIVDQNNAIYAYELLFRCVQSDGTIMPIFDDHLLATTRVLVNTLNHIGLNNLVGDKLALINIDEEMLMDTMIQTIPKERFVLELLETIVVTDKLIERVKELHAEGYHFALDDVHCSEAFMHTFTPLFPYVDILKLDITLTGEDDVKALIAKLKPYPFKLLAEKVENEAEFEVYKAAGCDYFQGYFFAKPKLITQEAMDPHYKNIFNLIKLLDKDIELDNLSLEFERQADITLQLLRFMNSGQHHLKTDIKSIKHAISLLGKIPLKQWLLLIAYSKSAHNNESAKVKSPLLEMAATRSKLMHDLMDELHHDKKRDHEAAFVGLLSLMHAIVHVPIDEILNELHVAQEIREAIVDHKGELGALLELVLAVEEFHMEDANEIAHKLKISEESFRAALLHSMQSEED